MVNDSVPSVRIPHVSKEHKDLRENDPIALGLVNSLSLLQCDRIVESAWLQHVPFGFWLISALNPNRIVELGVHRGASLTAFCQASHHLELKPEIVGVDTWEGDAHTGSYGEEILDDLAKYVSRFDFPVRLLRQRFVEAHRAIDDGSIDLLHIDGLHTYSAVEEDYRMWLPKMSTRGVIIFHDINVYERDFGVHRLWRELSWQYPSFEFLHGHGLGVLAVGNEPAPLISKLASLRTNQFSTETVRSAYHNLGLSVSRSYEISLRLNAELTDTKIIRYMVSPEVGNLELLRSRMIELEQRADCLKDKNLKLEEEVSRMNVELCSAISQHQRKRDVLRRHLRRIQQKIKT